MMKQAWCIAFRATRSDERCVILDRFSHSCEALNKSITDELPLQRTSCPLHSPQGLGCLWFALDAGVMFLSSRHPMRKDASSSAASSHNQQLEGPRSRSRSTLPRLVRCGILWTRAHRCHWTRATGHPANASQELPWQASAEVDESFLRHSVRCRPMRTDVSSSSAFATHRLHVATISMSF